ncbi:MAG: SusC/RagA family TonB-linked outer membrane protein [Puia sp.]
MKKPFTQLLRKLYFLLMGMFFSGFLLAAINNTQDLDKIIIPIQLKNATLKKAFHIIESETKLSFTYKTKDVGEYDNINYSSPGVDVARLLNDLLRGTDLQYEQMDNNIIIKKKQKLLSAPGALPADHGVYLGGIHGVISNEKGEPVVGASVAVIELNKGTAANSSGEFTLAALRPGKYRIQVSAVGFQTQVKETTVTDQEQTELDFELKEGKSDLDEVVVTALGITRKERSLGYSTQSVKGDNLTMTKEQNVLGSLAGKIAGVQVSGSSGASMGGTEKIQIRGVNSVTGAGEPLIVVDNTPVSNNNFANVNGPDYGNLAQDINPDDIESVNVLKGPAASALYGLRGQFGVIMITTKKGSRNAKKPTVNFSSAYSMEKAGNFLPLQNLYGAGSSLNFETIEINGVDTKYVDGSWDESWGPKMDGSLVRQYYSFYPADPDFGKATPFLPHPDNVKDWFVTGHTLNNNISFAGGGQNTSFRLSYNNTSVTGIEPNTFLKRNNLTFTGSLNITPKLVVSTNLNYAQNSAQRPLQGYYNGSRNFYQWFERSLDMKKLKQYKYPDGTFLQWNINDPDDQGIQEDQKPIDWNNPYFEAYENPAHDNRDRLFGNVGMTYTILPGLQVSGFVRSDLYTQNLDTRDAEGGRFTPDYTTAKYQSKEMNYEFMAQYNKEFGKISLNVSLGGNILTQNFTFLKEATVGGFVTPGFFNISNSLERPDVSNYLRKKEIRSAYGSVTLGYINTYYLEATLRNDISSTLPLSNNSYLYPSLSASLVFSELLKWEPLSYGKLRVSFAQAGSDIDAYQTSNSYNIGSSYNGSFPVYVPDALNNPNLEPSLSTAYEAGIEMRFFRDRLGINVTYYTQENKKAVFDLNVPGASGYTSTTINAGNIQNQGIELTLTGTPLKTRYFSWVSAFNFSHNKSKIKALYPGINTLELDENTYSKVTMYLNANVNEPFGTLVGNAYQRDPATGKVLLSDANLPMAETNHNFGSVLPKFTGGWQNTFIWKGFDLGVMIDFQSGGKFFSWTDMLSVKSGQAAITAAMNDKGHNIRDDLADGGGVKVNGISASTGKEVTAYVNARSYYRNTLGTKIYEEWLIDASYVKMREVRLGYTFTKANFAKLPFAALNLAFISRNPFMVWQKAPKGLNPAELSTGSSSLNWLETGQLATTRSYGVNLNITF